MNVLDINKAFSLYIFDYNSIYYEYHNIMNEMIPHFEKS